MKQKPRRYQWQVMAVRIDERAIAIAIDAGTTSSTM
jgi:hypothetical protein